MKNREIKFRVWTGSQMEYNVMAGFLGSFYVQGMSEKDAACMSSFNTKYSNETPLMQFTGLKDKNGKEIYEGDILQTGNEIHEVSFVQSPRKGYYPDYGFPNLHNFPAPDWVEVIGNIYENKELLK